MFLFRQSDTHRTYRDETFLIQVADGTLIYFLADVEALVDVVCLALVAKVAFAIVVEEILVERLGEVGGLLDARLLKGDVNLAVRTYSADVALHLVTGMDVLEDLALVEQAWVLVVDDDLEAEVGLLPDEQIYFLSMLVVGMVLVHVSLHLG